MMLDGTFRIAGKGNIQNLKMRSMELSIGDFT